MGEAVARFGVEVEKVSKALGGRPVIRDVSFTVPAGQVTALIGPSGTGKTTMMRLMMGITQPDSGRIEVDGRDITKMSMDQLNAMRSEVGVLVEGAGALFSSMTVFDNVAFPLRQIGRLPEAEVARVATAHLEEVGLANDARKMPEQLSVGMRVRASYARATVLQPKMLVFDSPDLGMDSVRLALLFQLMAEANQKLGCTTMVLTHEIAGVFRIADYVVLMRQGEIIAHGTKTAIEQSPDAFTQQFINGLMAGPMKAL
ncbi:MAG: ATP-binding cassette domain-containing protein [Candidatus Dormibacteraeota bacterium]|nr:ATP-binding cassette domain-containing protein [Candidatus Dormibacteraeota bacterium]